MFALQVQQHATDTATVRVSNADQVEKLAALTDCVAADRFDLDSR
jgi:hypothetical protein